MKLYKQGAYLVRGEEIILEASDAQTAVASKVGRVVSKEEAKENTIAYGILKCGGRRRDDNRGHPAL